MCGNVGTSNLEMSSLFKQVMPCRMLHVTPETAASRLFEELLGLDSNARFEHIATGISAIRELKRRPDHELPNLIVVAWWLPFLTGTEFVEQIKSDERLAVIPIIVFDSDLPEHEAGRLYDAGANCVIQDIAGLDMYSHFADRFRAFWLGTAVLPSWPRTGLARRAVVGSASAASRESF
jgi:two-component system, chemotaxis family, response regulator Rcp1